MAKPVHVLNGPNLNLLGTREVEIYGSETLAAIEQRCRAAADRHTSLALHDALKTLGVPLVEIHLSNVYKREPIRHKRFVSPLATGVICGFGPFGYELALEAIARLVAP